MPFAVDKQAKVAAVTRLIYLDRQRNDPGGSDPTLAEIVAAINAVFDVLDGSAFRTTMIAAIDAATAPTNIPGPQQKRIVARVMEEFFRDELT